MNIRYPIYEGVYRILTFLGGVLEQVKEVTGEIFRIYQAKNNP